MSCTASSVGLECSSNGLVKDEEFMKQRLPYVDVTTGLRGRLVLRDPISGLGELPVEVDPLKGNRLRGQTQPEWGTTVPRNPIRLEGDLGEEYNCLYTTKSLTCKPRMNRDIITLEGDLGEELDPLHPMGGKFRRTYQRNAERDPIAGIGDFGPREWDPIWKEHGRLRLNRPEEKKRDPITHTVPLENMGEKEEKSLVRHYPDRINRDDPITHTVEGMPVANPLRFSLRMFRDKKNLTDPICHSSPEGSVGSRHSLRFFSRDSQRRNPITHEAVEPIRMSQSAAGSECGNGGMTFAPNQNYIVGKETTFDSIERLLNSTTANGSEQSKLRNPISGEGLQQRDYVDLLKVSTERFTARKVTETKSEPTAQKKDAPAAKKPAAGATEPKKVTKPSAPAKK